MRQVARLAVSGRGGIEFEIGGEKRVAIGHRDPARRIGANALIPGHREDVRRREPDQRLQIFGRLKPAVAVDGRNDRIPVEVIGIETACDLAQVEHRLPESGACHHEGVAKRRAARGVPGNAVSPLRRIMESFRRAQDRFGGCRRFQPLLGKQVLAKEQELRRRLARDAVWTPAPVRRAPARGVEIARIEPVHVHDFVEREQNALGRELADPRQVDSYDVIAAGLALGVAQRLLVQAIDREGALVDFCSDNLFELALECVHHHESRIAVHQNAQSTRQRKRLRQNLRRLDRVSGHVGAAKIIVPGAGIANAGPEGLRDQALHPTAHLRPVLDQLRAGMQCEALSGTRARTLLDHPGLQHLVQSPDRRGVGNAGRRRQR